MRLFLVAVCQLTSYRINQAAVLSPPDEPFIAIIQRELSTLLFACLAWAWSVLGIKLASLGRSQIIYNAPPAEIVSGKFVERTVSFQRKIAFNKLELT